MLIPSVVFHTALPPPPGVDNADSNFFNLNQGPGNLPPLPGGPPGMLPRGPPPRLPPPPMHMGGRPPPPGGKLILCDIYLGKILCYIHVQGAPIITFFKM